MVEVFLKDANGDIKAVIRRFQSVSPLRERYRWLNQKLLLHNYSFRHYCIVNETGNGDGNVDGDGDGTTGKLSMVSLDSVLFKGFKIEFEERLYILPMPIYDHD